MNSISLNGYKVTIPSSAEELTPKQVKLIAPLLVHKDSVDLRIHIIFKLIKQQLPWWRHKMLREGKIDGVGLVELAKLLDWLPERYNIQATSNVDPLVASFKYKGREYLLPEYNFNDVTVEEFNFINLYLETLVSNPARVFELAAAICRPARSKAEQKSMDWDGYRRIPFNPETIYKRQARFKKLPLWIQAVVSDYCIRSRMMLHERYKVMFDGPKSANPGFGWKGIILSVAETGVFGPEQRVKHVNLHDVCIFACKKRKEQKEFERRLEAS